MIASASVVHSDTDVDGPIDEHPITPAGRIIGHPVAAMALVAFTLTAAILAWWNNGSLLLTWDEPIQRWVEDNRTDANETFFRFGSRLGSNVVIFSVGAVMALVAASRSRVLAVTIIGAVALRPLIEFVVKALVSRPRPDLERLLTGTGFSHPSGHAFASVALYGLLPAVVALFLRHRIWWWLTAAVVVVGLVPVISASRVVLGVHWTTDVVAGIALGTLYLLLVEWVFVRLLHRFPGHAGRWRPRPAT